MQNSSDKCNAEDMKVSINASLVRILVNRFMRDCKDFGFLKRRPKRSEKTTEVP